MKPTELTIILFCFFGAFLGSFFTVMLDKDNATVIERPAGTLCQYNGNVYALISFDNKERQKELKNYEDWELAVSTR